MPSPGGSYYAEFVTSNPATGAAVNADSLPAATANHNGTDDGSFTLTVANIDTGRYKVTGTIPAYAAGDSVSVSVAATVSSVAAKGIIDKFEVIPAVVLADAVAHGGTPGSSTATYAGNLFALVNPSNTALKIWGTGNVLDLQSTSGSGGTVVLLKRSGDNGNIIQLADFGDGVQSPLAINANGPAPAMVITAGSSGSCIDLFGPFTTAGPAVRLLDGGAGGGGIQIAPGGTAHGVDIAGGSTSGDAVHKTATDGHGDFSQGGNGKAAVVPGTLAIGS